MGPKCTGAEACLLNNNIDLGFRSFSPVVKEERRWGWDGDLIHIVLQIGHEWWCSNGGACANKFDDKMDIPANEMLSGPNYRKMSCHMQGSRLG